MPGKSLGREVVWKMVGKNRKFEPHVELMTAVIGVSVVIRQMQSDAGW